MNQGLLLGWLFARRNGLRGRDAMKSALFGQAIGTAPAGLLVTHEFARREAAALITAEATLDWAAASINLQAAIQQAETVQGAPAQLLAEFRQRLEKQLSAAKGAPAATKGTKQTAKKKA